MEIFLILVAITLLIIFSEQQRSNAKKFEQHIDQIKKQLSELKRSAPVAPPASPEPTPAPAPPKIAAVTPPPVVEHKPEPVREEVIAPKVQEPVKPEPVPIPRPATLAGSFTDRNPKPAGLSHQTSPIEGKSKPAPVYQPTFFERNPDLEKFIGENLINKIGIAILVLGIGFFVKYAIDQNWINEYGRAGIGILSGGILLGFAHYLRKRFTAFSSVLVGGGIATLYFTIGIAFHEYHLLGQTAAFIVMLVITVFSVLLTLAYDRLELAVLSLIGGFATPFMVSTGEGNYVVLFTYLMILNVGMLTLAYFKKWNLINILSYVFTLFIFGGWMSTKLVEAQFPPYTGALIFASLFYMVFFAMNIINNLKTGRKFALLDFSILLSNTFLYYGAGMFILNHIRAGYYEGMFTASLAIFNFIFAFFLYKNQKVDKNLVYLLIGLVLSFVSLTAPIQLEGNYITLFWAAETVLLLWLSQRSGIRLMKIGSCIVMVLMIFSLLMDWQQVYFAYYETTLLNILLNKGFITGLVSVVSMGSCMLLLKKEKDEYMFGGFPASIYSILLGVVGTVLLYCTLLIELHYQLYARLGYEPANTIIIGFYNVVFVIGLFIVSKFRDSQILKNVVLLLGAFVLLTYMVYYNEQTILIRNDYLTGSLAVLSNYLFHYLLTTAILVLLFLFFRSMKKEYGLNSSPGTFLLWFTTLVLVYVASAELSHLCVMVSYSAETTIEHIIKQTYKIGFPILWGICSFSLMALGMRLKMKHLRIISLSLFLVTLLKLFIFDIQGISEGGKIAAFISLGVILLIVSFMYQKLKVLVLEDDPDKQKTETAS